MEKCEKCGKEMKIRKGKSGEFLGCSGYPECKNTKPIGSAPEKPLISNLQLSNHTIVLNKTEKPHSYEFGRAGMRHKIYYGTIDELKTHIDLLKAAELVEPEFPIEKIE